jgi:hypothetical protein
LELAFINVAEQATIANTQVQDAQGYEENYDAAEKGGRSAGGPLRKNTAVRSSATNPISSSGKVWRRAGTKLMSLTWNDHLRQGMRSQPVQPTQEEANANDSLAFLLPDLGRGQSCQAEPDSRKRYHDDNCFYSPTATDGKTSVSLAQPGPVRAGSVS